MRMQPKIIKQSAFVDGTYQIKAAPATQILRMPGVGPFQVDAGLPVDDTPAIDPRVVAAEAEAELLLALAREQALGLLAEAHAAVDALRDQATEAGREAGHAEGLSLGRQEGLHAIELEEARRLEVLGDAIAAFDREQAARAEAHAQELAKLAIVIAQKVLAVELGFGREAAVPLARAALQKVTDKAQVRLRVHPLDRAAIVAAKELLLLSVDGLTHLDVVADPQMGLGGCLIETRTGMVDAKLATQLSEIAAAMLDVRAGVEEGGEMDPVVAAALRALGRGAIAPTELRPAPRVAVEAPARPARKMQVPAPAPAAPAVDAAAEARALLEAARIEAATLIAEAQIEAEARVARVEAPPEPEWAPPAIEIAALVAEALPEPQPLFFAPVAEPEPEAPAAAPAPKLDPSKRAAQALAVRLGQMRAGRAVLSIEEELDLKNREQGDKDEALEALVKQVNLHQTDIGLNDVLVYAKPALNDAADVLAARLGQKVKEKKPVIDGVLADDAIAAVLDGVGHRAAGETPLAAEPAEEPNLEKATDNLAKLLGVKRKGSARKPWYDGLDG